ncbi:MAG TPA: sugar phosphate isomerase/epimerase [Cyclobacteriaceae bacterium]|nr:sugar phosphate isomerase/epimerase [Cyclobacteriaceae bacterium]
MNRRTFIERSALAAGGLALASLPGCSSSATAVNKPIGIQLYTLREIFEKDVMGTLKLVADTGFKEVEAYGYDNGKIFGIAYADFAAEVKRLGMRVVSGHYGTGQSTPEKAGTPVNEWERTVNDAKAAGQQYTTIAWLDQSEWNTSDALKRTCEILNKAGEITKKYDIRMAYHNHAFEFGKVEGEVVYDVMLKELDPSLVTMELDIYWIVFAGHDPLTYFRNHPGRFELWHVKDMDKTDRNKNSDVGSGTIDFKPLFAAAGQSGMKHFFLEQEYFAGPPDKSIANGYSYLKDIL